MVSDNDNQTYAQFQAGEAARRGSFERWSSPAMVFYHLMRNGREWMLLRTGRVGGTEIFGHFPTAGGPHPWCPPHNYEAPQAHRPPLRSAKARPSYLRAV